MAALVVGLVGACVGSSPEEGPETRLMVFAAASLRDALEATREGFEEAAGAEISFNFAGSNLLAQQIEAAPRGDVFLSANERWMDYVDERDLLEPGSRRGILSNALVVVVNNEAALELRDPRDLAELPFRFLSIGDPEAVPAGRYARSYLESLATAEGTVWGVVRERVAPAPDVRAALGLVEAEPDVVGIVYKTDAAASPRVKVLYEVPRKDGPKISYSAAVVGSSKQKELAHRYLAYLQGAEASAELERQGFVVLEPEASEGGGGG